MIGEQKNTAEGHVVVATKVAPMVAELLTILAKMRGMEVYELLQLLIGGFISYAKSEIAVSDEFRHLYESLKFDVAWNMAYNFASPTAQQDIAQMILILQQKGKTGFGLTMIDKPFMDSSTMTTSLPLIAERILELTLGSTDYMRLRRMAIDHHAQSHLDMIRKMIAEQSDMDIKESNQEEMPGYGQYHDFGRAIKYGQRTKRVKHRTPDMYIEQGVINFGEEDRQLANEEVNDSMKHESETTEEHDDE